MESNYRMVDLEDIERVKDWCIRESEYAQEYIRKKEWKQVAHTKIHQAWIILAVMEILEVLTENESKELRGILKEVQENMKQAGKEKAKENKEAIAY